MTHKHYIKLQDEIQACQKALLEREIKRLELTTDITGREKKILNLRKKILERKPPCVFCHRLSFEHCRDNNYDCRAFRYYIGHGFYKQKDIGKLKEPFDLEDKEYEKV